MNIVLWIVQALLAFQTFAGGAYKLAKFDEIAKMPQVAAIPHGAWSAMGVLEMVLAVLLLAPAATKWMPVLTPVAATLLAVESFALAAFYASYSTELAATNPLVWVAGGGVIAAFVAFGRFKLKPIA